MESALVPLVVPQLGTAMDEVAVSRWLVQVGDAVRRGDPVVEIEAAKATSELEAPVDGVVTAIHVAEDAEIEVGQLLAEFEDRS
ncbi:lipoyl domain-containing protein [Actinomadura macra]|uniref:lipoyl domain-containing protein n=1 Tax=Actinomadura macra TaxID=46164 RepID=UPI00083466DC|nr:lipoyl domain-containing protein [Actinomadura macra]